MVVSVDYRLAPETPYPGPIQDCYRGLHWMHHRAHELHIDPRRMAMYGSSAGGGLAAATALMVRDYGGPHLRLIMLNAPMLDDRNSSPSALNFADAPTWSRADNLRGWQAYLGNLWGSDTVMPYAVPGRASNLHGLPPVFITVGNIDVFRDECVEFASRLMRDGNDVELHVWPGVFHAAEQFSQAAIVKRMASENQAAMIRALSS
ncbi:MAG: alpha/beta hydrolase [Firmicutes bacterium]|nr:alpha/beta hydrolase [Bacillota bacterium]